jgi:hypothetical protein
MFVTFEGISPLAAQASEWFYLASTQGDTLHVFFDQASISRRGNIASMRSMFVYPQISEDGVVAFIQLDELDCDKNQWRVVQLTSLYDDQTTVRQERENLSNEWEIVQPQSFGELKIETACGSNQSR